MISEPVVITSHILYTGVRNAIFCMPVIFCIPSLIFLGTPNVSDIFCTYRILYPRYILYPLSKAVYRSIRQISCYRPLV